MKKRCEWAKDEPNITYHDNEWGTPQHDDQKLFEFLILEGAQAGLSWTTILNRREGYRKAFSDFDAKKVSKYTQKRIEKLLKDESIIRNDSYLWGFVNHKQIKNKFKKHSELPATSEISEKLSKDLKKRGFNFVGPTICYALMQAIGMVNDHTSDCYLYKK
jgi:DNA-3-methyladenine glycosylase I